MLTKPVCLNRAKHNLANKHSDLHIESDKRVLQENSYAN